MKKVIIKTLIICSLLPIVNTGVTVKAEELKTPPTKTITMNISPKNFEEINPDKSIKSTWRTPFERIGNTNYEFSIAGKGDNREEEGIGTVLVKNVITNKYKEFKFIDKINLEHPQTSALTVFDGYNNTLLVNVGCGWGSIQWGSELYSLNVETGTSELIYSAGIGCIVNAKINGNQIDVTHMIVGNGNTIYFPASIYFKAEK